MSLQPLSLLYPATRGLATRPDRTAFSTNYVAEGGNYARLATNLRIDEDGRFRTRFPWREIAVEAPEEWLTADSQAMIPYLPQRGQGAHYFSEADDGLVESARGKLWSIDLGADTATVSDVSCGQVDGEDFLMAWLTQAENYVLRTDGHSNTQVWNGQDCVSGLSGLTTDPANATFPNGGGAAAYSDGRTWAEIFGREIVASDQLASLSGTASDILRFSQQATAATSTTFSQPTSLGTDVVAMFPFYDPGSGAADGVPYLMVAMLDGGLWGIRQGVPRAQWESTLMVRQFSTQSAPTGPYAHSSQDGEIVYRSHRGIESLRMLGNERSNPFGAHVDLSASIAELLDSDDRELLIFAQLVNSTRFGRMMSTVSPQSFGTRHWHNGYISAKWNPQRTTYPGAHAWEGLNVLPDEMGRIVHMVEGIFGGRERVIALTVDPETGRKRLIEQIRADGPDELADGTTFPIGWQMQTRKITAGSEFLRADMRHMMLGVYNVEGDFSYDLTARTERSCCWRDVQDGAGHASDCGETCGNCYGLAGAEDSIPLGSLANLLDGKSRWVQFVLRGSGVGSIDLAMDEPGSPEGVPQDKEDMVLRSECSRCEFDPFEYWNDDEEVENGEC
jgi:hypothetical protein